VGVFKKNKDKVKWATDVVRRQLNDGTYNPNKELDEWTYDTYWREI